MVLLWQRGDQATRLNDGANELAMAQATAGVAIRALIDKGLVGKERSASDACAVNPELYPQVCELRPPREI